MGGCISRTAPVAGESLFSPDSTSPGSVQFEGSNPFKLHWDVSAVDCDMEFPSALKNSILCAKSLRNFGQEAKGEVKYFLLDASAETDHDEGSNKARDRIDTICSEGRALVAGTILPAGVHTLRATYYPSRKYLTSRVIDRYNASLGCCLAALFPCSIFQTKNTKKTSVAATQHNSSRFLLTSGPGRAVLTLRIRRGEPAVQWTEDLPEVCDGMPLTAIFHCCATEANQLPGRWQYSPPATTILRLFEGDEGTSGQSRLITVTCTFTPADRHNYKHVVLRRTVRVVPSPVRLLWPTEEKEKDETEEGGKEEIKEEGEEADEKEESKDMAWGLERLADIRYPLGLTRALLCAYVRTNSQVGFLTIDQPRNVIGDAVDESEQYFFSFKEERKKINVGSKEEETKQQQQQQQQQQEEGNDKDKDKVGSFLGPVAGHVEYYACRLGREEKDCTQAVAAAMTAGQQGVFGATASAATAAATAATVATAANTTTTKSTRTDSRLVVPGSVLSAGWHLVTANFVPKHRSRYPRLSLSRVVLVLRGQVALAWPSPLPALHQGMPVLEHLHLCCSVVAPVIRPGDECVAPARGSFLYTPPPLWVPTEFATAPDTENDTWCLSNGASATVSIPEKEVESQQKRLVLALQAQFVPEKIDGDSNWLEATCVQRLEVLPALCLQWELEDSGQTRDNGVLIFPAGLSARQLNAKVLHYNVLHRSPESRLIRSSSYVSTFSAFSAFSACSACYKLFIAFITRAF
jgi:hypothetical protein